MFRLFFVFFCLISFSNSSFMTTVVLANHAWQKPGCHKVGHTRKISVPNCVEFEITTNACRGFCESWAVPSDPLIYPSQPITSFGQCCNIMETEPVEAKVLCIDGIKNFTFKSAVNCACYQCKKY